MKPSRTLVLLLCAVMLMTALCGCGASGAKPAEADRQEQADAQDVNSKLTVYLWDSSLMGTLAPYIKEQCPDLDIEFISGNNNVFLYDYLEKHGELPDIITTRRFSGADAEKLCPYLLDLSTHDVVGSFYSYVLQFYMENSGAVHWLPVCGIPETMIVNKTLLDEYEIAIPESYDEFADACAKLQENGIKPFVRDWVADYSCHSLFQGAALDRFTGLEGLQWRMAAESGSAELSFDDALWTDIISEVNTFIKDTGLTAEDAKLGWSQSCNLFTGRQAAISCGTPGNMAGFQSVMDDKLVRLPYFSQSSDESWVYTYPSLSIALNNSVTDSAEKLDAAMRVLNCFLSAEGQNIIAAGQGMISYNVDVPSDLTDMEGLEEEIGKNALYIRFASNASFSASLDAVQGLMTGEMTEQQAMESFKATLTAPAAKQEIVTEFDCTYSLAQNEKGGRDAASSVLTTVCRANGAELGFSPYYYYTASLHAGDHTKKEVSMMVKNGNIVVHLATAELTGKEVKTLVGEYLKDTGTAFQITTGYELPVASGMKLILNETDSGYALKDIEVGGSPIRDDAVFKVLLSTEFNSLFERVLPGHELPEKLGQSLSAEWTNLICGGIQPAAAEDYIEIR